MTRDELSGPPFPGPRAPLLVDQRVGVVPDAAQLVRGSLLQLSTVEQLYVVEYRPGAVLQQHFRVSRLEGGREGGREGRRTGRERMEKKGGGIIMDFAHVTIQYLGRKAPVNFLQYKTHFLM